MRTAGTRSVAALASLWLAAALALGGSAEPKAQRAGKLEPWPEAEEQKVDELLDRFFAAKDDAGRKAVFKELEATRLDRRFDELERMRELAATQKGLLRHLPVPGRKGAERGWYNLALPDGYTPAKAWPLVLALHGMPSDGDNLLSWYTGYFPRRGFIVLFPTTIDRSSFWPAPHERRELFRLLRHTCDLYRVDHRRIYCTGASGGGIGTWHWLTGLPELFAAGISFSAMGTIFDERLKKLKDVPFYVHHGAADPIPISTVERSIAMAEKYGAKIEFYASKGTGHTPPGPDWTRAFDWLTKQPPKKVSPRYLLECPEGALPTGYPRYLPFAGSIDAAELQKILAANKAKAAQWQVPAEVRDYDLIEGLAAVSKIVDPACDAAAIRKEAKRIADLVRAKAKGAAEPTDALYALNEVFFQNEGFCRDGSDLAGEKPEGLAASHVLKSRAGNVFTLAALYAAVAAELGLPVFPVATPYHGFARYDDGKRQVNVEPTELGGHFDDAIYVEGYGLA
jgi:predicted esterase